MTVDLRRAPAQLAAGGRVPPHNLEAEASVLGSLMLDRNAIVRVADFLRPDDFYLDHHAQVFRAALNLYDRADPIDLLTLASELEKMLVLERIGGQVFLAELESRVPTAANVEYYGHLVEEAAIKRKLIGAGGRITSLGFDDSTPASQALDTAESVIFNIAEGRITQDFVALKDILKTTWDQIEQIHKDQSVISGVPSGFSDLDAKTGGFQKSDLIIIAARPGVGKCLPAQTLIDDPVTGARLTIEQFFRERRPIVFGLSPRGRIEWRHISDWVDSGVQPCFAVTTQSGRRVEVTGHHPFMTITGWQPLHDLVVGDAIAVPRELRLFGKESIDPQRARLLGYFIGDGGLSMGTPAFTNIDPVIVDDFKSIVSSQFPGCHVAQRDITYFVSAWPRVRGLAVKERLSAYLHRVRRPITKSPLIGWLTHFELWGKKSDVKRFPDQVWRWNRETLREFLRALMSCDGSIFATRNGRPRIEFGVASERLAKDVHHAFVRFGIVARLYRKSERCWRVQITDSESVARYQAEIGWIGGKAGRFPKDLPQFRSNNGHLPSAVWKMVAETASSRGRSWAKLAVLSGERTRTSRFETYNPRTNHGLSQRRLAIFNEVLEDRRLAALANPELYWDRIVSIELTGNHQVYDLTVPEGANFIAEDVIVHNTSLTLNIAQHASIQYKIPVAIFSLEMSEQQLVTRLLCSEASVDSYRLRTGLLKDAEWPRIAQAMGALSEAQIYIDDSPNVSVMEMRTKARRLKSANNLGLIIVDYLQLMQGRNSENRVQEVSDISRSLKSLARELQVPVIACSQLSREPEKRPDHRPQLSDLRESGCLTGDTPVYLPDLGVYRPIAELIGQVGFRVLALNTNTWELERCPVEKAFSTGHKPVFRLTTQLGRSVRATANHKFLTISGWRRLDELSRGERVALPRRLIGPTDQTMTDDELALLGHLIGDGCTLPRHAQQYTTNDLVLAETVAALATRVFPGTITPRINRERGWFQVYLSATGRLTHRVRNPIARWLDGLGVFGLRSYEKFVPEKVFSQPRPQIARFLRHLWSTDGCIILSLGGDHYANIYYASSSARLARDVQSLLLRLEINARMTRHLQGLKGRPQYHVEVTGKADIERFVAQVGGLGASKSVQMSAISTYMGSRVANTNRDVIPSEVWRTIAVPAMQEAGLNSRAMQAELGNAYCGTTLYKQNLSRERTARLATVVGSDELWSIASSDVYWDRIASIEPDGDDDVYDLTVDRLHNFVAGNIVLHNSLEQDSDLVLFIYRERFYNDNVAEDKRNIAEIIIAKHRNGPTGKIELLFIDEQTKFANLDRRRGS